MENKESGIYEIVVFAEEEDMRFQTFAGTPLYTEKTDKIVEAKRVKDGLPEAELIDKSYHRHYIEIDGVGVNLAALNKIAIKYEFVY